MPDDYTQLLLDTLAPPEPLTIEEARAQGERIAKEQAEEAERIEQEKHNDFERRRRLAVQTVRREEEEADLSGAIKPEAEVFRDLRLKPKISEAHDFQPVVRVPVVQNLFFTNSLTWVAGQSGTFKSFVTADLAFRYGQEDMDYHGKRMTHGRALLVIAEGAAGYADRKTAWEKQHGREVKNVSIYPAPLQLADTFKEMPALISYLREEDEAGRPFTLIVFDTQAMCTVGVDENSSEMNKIISVLHQIREVSGACVMTVHHFGKNKQAGMRGSSMIYAAADTVCVLKRKEDATEVTLSTAQADEGKQKDAITEKDLLTLEMRAHPVSQDYFGDTVHSLVPVEAATPSIDMTDEPETAEPIPTLSPRQMYYIQELSAYQEDGVSASDFAKDMDREESREPAGGRVTRQAARKVWVQELKPKGLVELVPKQTSKWRVTARGAAAVMRALKDAQGTEEAWLERARNHRVRGRVREPYGEPLGEPGEPDSEPCSDLREP